MNSLVYHIRGITGLREGSSEIDISDSRKHRGHSFLPHNFLWTSEFSIC